MLYPRYLNILIRNGISFLNLLLACSLVIMIDFFFFKFSKNIYLSEVVRE